MASLSGNGSTLDHSTVLPPPTQSHVSTNGSSHGVAGTGSGRSSNGFVAPTRTGTGFSKLTGASRRPFGTVYPTGFASASSGHLLGSGSSAMGWARNPACTSSWQSRVKANNGTVITTKTYSYTAVLTDHSVSTFRLGEVITGPGTSVFNAGTVTYQVGDDDVCCGICNVLYPNVIVYYWPVKETNTWCKPYLKSAPTDGLQGPVPTVTAASSSDFPDLPNLPKISLPDPSPINNTSSQPPGADYSGIQPGGFGVEPPLQARHAPESTITPSPKAPGPMHQQLDARKFVPLQGLNLLNSTDPLIVGNSPHLNASQVSYAIAPDGFVFTSPSVYVVISTIQAKNKCGNVGGVHTSLTLSYAPSQLSTIDGISGETKVFNFADLPCPPSSWNFPNPLQGNTAALAEFAQTYHPRILAPQSSLKALDPAWKSCSIMDVGNGYDPPRPLTPVNVMASTTALPMCSDGSPAKDNLLYVENTAKHCLELASLHLSLPEKNPIFKTPEPGLVSLDNPGPNAAMGIGFLSPNTEGLVPEPTHLLAVPKKETSEPAPASPVAIPTPVPQRSPAAQVNPVPQVLTSVSPQQRPPQEQNPPPPGQNSPPPGENAPPTEQNTPPQEHKAPQGSPAPSSQAQQVVVQGQTIRNNAPAVTIGGQPVKLLNGNIHVGSTVAPAPTPPQQTTNPALVAGGLTFNPGPTNQSPPSAPSPTEVGGLTFSAPVAEAESPAPIPRPNPRPSPPSNLKPVVVGGQTYAPVQQPPRQPSPTPVVVGSLTFNPVQTPGTVQEQTSLETQKEDSPSEQNPAEQQNNPIVVGGNTYTPVAADPSPNNIVNFNGITAAPENGPILQSGLKSGPVQPNGPLATLAKTPLGVVGGQIISGGRSSAIVGGQTILPGSPTTIAGTRVSLGGSNLVIGTNSVPLPLSEPTEQSQPLGTVGGHVVSGDQAHAVVDGKTILPGSVVKIAGTPVSLGSSNIVIGTNSVPLPRPDAAGTNRGDQVFGTVGGQVISGDRSHAVVAGQTILPGSVATISGTPVSLGASNIVIGTSSVPLPSPLYISGLDGNNQPLGIAGGHVIKGDQSHAVVDGKTILPGSVATIAGTRVSLGPSNIVIGTASIPLPTETSRNNEPSAFSIAGTTISNGGAPITVSGTRISLGHSGLVVGTKTIPLTDGPSLGEQTSVPKVFSVDGTGVTQGSPAVTISGTRVSVGASNVVIGSKTINLPSSSIFTAGGQTFTPRANGFSIDGTTLTPGGSTVTIAGTKVSLASGSELVVGSSTIAVPAGPSPTLSVDGQTLTKISADQKGSAYLIDGYTITPGGSAVTVSGTPVSINPSNSLVIGSSTIALATAGSGAKASGENSPLTAGHETFIPIDSTAVSVDGTTLTVSGPAFTESDGTVVSLGPSGLVVGSSTYAFPTPASDTLTAVTNGPIAGSPGVFTIDGETFTAAATSALVIGSTSLSEGGPPVTINGTIISLGTSALTVGASTIPLASVSGLTSALTAPPTATNNAAAATSGAEAGGGPMSPGPAPTGTPKSAAGKLEIGDWKVILGVAVLTLIVGWILFM